MKINLLHMIIIATTFSSLQIHTMENQQLALQAQQHAYQSLYQSVTHENKIVIAEPLINTNHPNLLIAKNNDNIIPMKEQYTAVSLEPVDDISPTTPLQDNQNLRKSTIIRLRGADPTPIADLLAQKDNISLHCCNKNIICTKNAMYAAICGTFILATVVIVALVTTV